MPKTEEAKAKKIEISDVKAPGALERTAVAWVPPRFSCFLAQGSQAMGAVYPRLQKETRR